ncbi:MAG: sulfite exporter TauE/SafE family protein [Acidimicrobiia bacterium]
MTVGLLALVGLILLGLLSGSLGALVGIGGGVVIVPALTLLFGFDIKTAIAASLVAVVVTSITASGRYVRLGLVNTRLALTLELATALGGLTGGFAGTLVPSGVLSVVFGVLLVVTGILSLRGRGEHGEQVGAAGVEQAGWETSRPLGGAFWDERTRSMVSYTARRLPIGEGVSFVAGLASGLLGIGGGVLKVPAMNLGMDVPVKVAAATSSFMIGVTATAGLSVYLGRGFVHPGVAAPLALGVLTGALAGARFAGSASPRALRTILGVILVLVAVVMVVRGLG